MYIFKGLCDEFKLDINTLYTWHGYFQWDAQFINKPLVYS
jgi:hypothetical protein